MKVSRGGRELSFTFDCRRDFARYREKRFELVCVWIGTVWRWVRLFAQRLILQTSIGISGAAPTTNAYERPGIMSVSKHRRISREYSKKQIIIH
jgi:hypothetical protein